MPERNDSTFIEPPSGRRAVLVGVQLPERTEKLVRSSLDELERLVSGLGITVTDKTVQRRSGVSSSVLGKGKLRELSQWVVEAEGTHSQADLVIVDLELSPHQLQSMALEIGAQVLDRTDIILRVFEQRARTREARLQVELARLLYELPRVREDRSLGDREGGGGRGGRGHTNVELSKQRMRARVAALKRELAQVQKARETSRARRSNTLRAALVGYTNAGKSAWMRALTGSEVGVMDQLFATLDTTVRILRPETAPRILVSDTVGFIDDLPHTLIASFRSTLEEALDAALLLLVVDVSDPEWRRQLDVTRTVIGEIGGAALPSLVVLNKIDRVATAGREPLRTEFPEALQVSAYDGHDATRLHQAIVRFFERSMVEKTLCVPYKQGHLLAEIRDAARVLSESYTEQGTELFVRGPPELLGRFKAVLTN